MALSDYACNLSIGKKAIDNVDVLLTFYLFDINLPESPFGLEWGISLDNDEEFKV